MQLRPVDNGTIFTVEELQELRKKGVKIVITCHEYSLNYVLGKKGSFAESYSKISEPNSVSNQISLNLFKIADHVIFFNQNDLELASKSCLALKNKSSFSQVVTPMSIGKYGSTELNSPPILKDEIKKLSSKPANLMMFGLIRSGKGFEKYAVHLAKSLRESNQKNGTDHKLVIVGGINDPKVAVEMVEDLVNKELGNWLSKRLEGDYKTQAIQIHSSITNYMNRLAEKLPVEFHFFAKPEEVLKLFNRCKYAFVCDNIKGFANNASAMITVLAGGTILYANKGCCTLGEEEYSGAIQWVDLNNKNGTPKEVAEYIVVKGMEHLEKNPLEQERIFKATQTYFYGKFSSQSVKNTLEIAFDKMVNESNLNFQNVGFQQNVNFGQITQNLINENQQNQKFIHQLQ